MKENQPLGIIINLCKALNDEGIVYCHWKSTNALDRSETAENDLDLLVSRKDAQRFIKILLQLGFKGTEAPIRDHLPGVLNFYGYDHSADKFVHVHTYFQLTLGHDLSKNYRIPIEEPFLRSSTRVGLFNVPAPEFEWIIFIIRMVLKHFTWDTLIIRQGNLSDSEQQELEYLRPRIAHNQVQRLLEEYFPYIRKDLFHSCEQSLLTGHPHLTGIITGHKLQRSLLPFTRRQHLYDSILKLYRRYTWALQKRFFHYDPKQCPLSGGLFIAIIGGDGAGKTTAVDSLREWLKPHFDIFQVHLGKPKPSMLTLFIRGILKIGRTLGLYPYMRAPVQYTQTRNEIIFPGYPWLLREICTARDRYLTYIKAKRIANKGGLVISDRFPIPQVKFMDGPLAELMTGGIKNNWFIKLMIELEGKIYKSISPPDLLIVLRVNPEIAIQRKVDEEPLSVYARSEEIWNIDWQRTSAYVIDGNHSKAEVLSELKKVIWSKL
jgi:thymidylate kinase